MAEKIQAYVLDSFALLAYFQAERGGLAVRALFESAHDSQVKLHVSLINVGEMYYITHREQGHARAEEMLRDLRALPVTLEPATEERILASARIKSTYPLSYADAFAVTLTQEFGATLVTGDPEFQNVASLVKLLWLSPSNL
ncbi:MAG: type II toxin-antitoxin system VapC family toxin [Chloroflexi bacterium]|nr:type II toxin-antitoxin system VapC family toxin [Chloroflexota bacterium]